MPNTKKKAYLYGRVSNTSQASEGHGLERQVEAAKKFLELHPEYVVDDSTIIRDAGVSAYSGANIADSAGLGGFLNAVREGLISRGSLLVLEAPDRLTRLGIRKGQRLFDELAESGIDIGLVRFGVVIRHDADNDFTSSLIISIGLYLGHLESKQKSERICATMSNRRAQMREGKVYAVSNSPKWLTADPDTETFSVNSLGLGIKEMFKLRLKGFGAHKIAAYLNDNGFKTLDGSPWKSTAATHYLRSRTVLGEYQPSKVSKVKGKRVDVPMGEPIVDYYPRLIDDATFYEVQKLLDIGNGGRKAEFKNYLRGLVHCKYCGDNMIIQTSIYRGHVTSKYHYLRCQSRVQGGKATCDSKPINFKKADKYILPALRQFDFTTVYSRESVTTGEGAQRQLEIEKLTLALESDKKALEYLTGASRDAVDGVILSNQKRLAELSSQIGGSQFHMSQEEVVEKQVSIRESALDTYESRQEFNTNISRFVSSIRLGPKAWTISFVGSDLVLSINYPAHNAAEVLSKVFEHRRTLEKPQNDIEYVKSLIS